MITRSLRFLLTGIFAAVLWTQAVAAATPATSDNQILVMLRLPPPHFRAGSTYNGGYGEDQARGGRQRIAAAIARRHGLTLAGNWPMPVIGVDCFIMTIASGGSASVTAVEVTHDNAVRWAQPINKYHVLGDNRPDPLFAAQPTAAKWHLAAMHRVATGRGVKVALVDSQVEAAHPDLVGQIAVLRDFVIGRPTSAEDHGTGVAGVIAAKAWNGLGIAGVAPAARLYALRACWQSDGAPTVCDTLSLAKAIAFAVEQHTDIINLSLSGPRDRLLMTLLDVAMSRGAAIVAAFDHHERDGGFPASLDGVISVAAGFVDNGHSSYWAPGPDIPTTQPGGRWDLVSGASYTTAEVTGLLALMKEHYGSTSRGFVSDRIAGGEIDGCATLLGKTAICSQMAMRDPQ